MSKQLKDAAPQQRLLPSETVSLLNLNRSLPFISSVTNIDELMLLLGADNTTIHEITEDNQADTATTLNLLNSTLEPRFIIRSTANPVVLIKLPKTVSDELLDILTNQITYRVPTIFVPVTVRSTMVFHRSNTVLPESSLTLDIEGMEVNWDSLKRIVEYMDTVCDYNQLHNITPVGVVTHSERGYLRIS